MDVTERKIYKIINNIIIEYIVKPNPLIEGWSILYGPPDKEGYQTIYPVLNEALNRNRFESIERAKTYVGCENIIYYNTLEEATEVLELYKRMQK
jgi:hypothetical protein